ncbi:hypothetical protein [Limnobacter sp.]|uniref:hypothetical protein n=1 Tax=Limnobacter sp. TaxID=2003368 RepID=UPI00351248D7
MKPIIHCLEDFEMHRFILESHLQRLLNNDAEVHYFRTMGQLKKTSRSCHLLISDLHLPDSPGEQTAKYLLSICEHTPVLVQSSDPILPDELAQRSHGKIMVVEKGGQGPRFEQAIDRFMAQHKLTFCL